MYTIDVDKNRQHQRRGPPRVDQARLDVAGARMARQHEDTRRRGSGSGPVRPVSMPFSTGVTRSTPAGDRDPASGAPCRHPTMVDARAVRPPDPTGSRRGPGVPHGDGRVGLA